MVYITLLAIYMYIEVFTIIFITLTFTYQRGIVGDD